MDVQRKLEILADAAKYDASCASSGTEKRDSSDGKGLGSTVSGMGICHSYAPDGRCISLLKVLLTNACNYDCLYCVNRTSSNVPRARFTVDEVVKLTIDFYLRKGRARLAWFVLTRRKKMIERYNKSLLNLERLVQEIKLPD